MPGTSPLHGLDGMESALVRVEEALHQAVRSDDAFLTEVAAHLIGAGGKRIRPALAIASACVARGDGSVADVDDDIIAGAVSVELVHLGSLYHDDVMDEAATRRNVESVNHRWGNLVAILAGDFLLAKASEIASSLGTEIAGLLAATIGRLCEGQVAELQHVYQLDRTEDSYYRSIAGKTAALLATSCRIGGLVGGLPRDHVDVLTRYGDRFGMMFQVVDDVLDVVATDEQLGKPAGNDMAEGVYTLPVIRALAEGDDVLRDLLGAPLDREQSAKARELVQADGAIAYAVARAGEFADEAAAALRALPPAPAVEALSGLARHLVTTIPG